MNCLASFRVGVESAKVQGESRADRMLRRYDELDAQLVARGFPATSPWWREQLERFYRSTAYRFVARVGRRGGKSSTMSRWAVVEALYGEHDIPPGDVGTVAIISTRKGEARMRLRTIKVILDALGVEYAPSDDGGIELVGRNVVVKVYAASVAGVSGFTGIFVLCDEVAKWLDNDTGANPANEVLASVGPTIATQRDAVLALVSSPFGTWDAHFDAVEAGNTSAQVVAYAPSWEANPTLTEARTRELEPDERKWLREYKAIPSAEVESSMLSEATLQRTVPQIWRPVPGHTYVATTDPATRGNAWTLVVTTRTETGAYRVVLAKEWRGSASAPLDPDDVAAEQAAMVQPFGIEIIYGDQWSADTLRKSYARAGIGYADEPWTTSNKAEAYRNLRTIANNGELELVPDEDVRTDLLSVCRVLTRNGESIQLAERNGRHADYAPAIAMGVRHATVLWRNPLPDKGATLKARILNRSKSPAARLPITHRR